MISSAVLLESGGIKKEGSGISTDSVARKPGSQALLASPDSIPENNPKDSSARKVRRPGFWMAGAAAGSFYQEVQLSDYLTDQY